MSKRIALIMPKKLEDADIIKLTNDFNLCSVTPCSLPNLFTFYENTCTYFIKDSEDDDAIGVGASFLYDTYRYAIRRNTNPHEKEISSKNLERIQKSVEKWLNIVHYFLNNQMQYVGIFITSDDNYDYENQSIVQQPTNQVSYLTAHDLNSTRILFMQYGVIYFFE